MTAAPTFKQPSPTPSPDGLAPIDEAVFEAVQVTLDASLGLVELSVAEAMKLAPGAVLKLDLKVNDLVPLRLGGRTVALGEIVAVDEHFAVRIVQVAEPAG